MNPERRSFRFYSKIVAIVDLIQTSFSVFFVFFGLLSVISYTSLVISLPPSSDDGPKKELTLFRHENNSNQNNPGIGDDNDEPFKIQSQDKAFHTVIVVVLWIAIFLATLIIILQVVAAVKLMNATQLGQNPVVAAQQARFWKNITIVFTILLAVSFMMKGKLRNPAAGLLAILTRLVGLWIVHNFIKELDNRPTLPTTQVFYNAGGGMVAMPPQQHGQPLYPGLPTEFNGQYVYGPPLGTQYAPPPSYNEANKYEKS